MANIAIPSLLRHLALSLGASLLFYGVAFLLPTVVGDILTGLGHLVGLLMFLFTTAAILPIALMGTTVQFVSAVRKEKEWVRFLKEFHIEVKAPRMAIRLWVYSLPSAAYGTWSLFHKAWPQ